MHWGQGWGLRFQRPVGPTLTFTAGEARGGADRNCGWQSGLSGEAPSRARWSRLRAQSGARAMEQRARGCTAVVAAVSGDAGSHMEPCLGLGPPRGTGTGPHESLFPASLGAGPPLLT